jgi:hypothetical protein
MESRIELLEHRLEGTERRLHTAERRLRATWVIAFGGVVGAFVLGLHPEAQAQFAITLTSLQNQINALTPRVTAVENRATALESKTQFVSIANGDMFITGTNLIIQNGLGATNGHPANPLDDGASGGTTVNGKGNLIIGYNASRATFDLISGTDVRTGSHNLVMGDFNNYSRFGGIVAGVSNTISGAWASINGGNSNTASGTWASVSGGDHNIASGASAWIGGGQSNTASGEETSISGGLINRATSRGASVSGGQQNTASGVAASVSGGVLITQGNQSGWSAGGNGGAGVFHSP